MSDWVLIGVVFSHVCSVVSGAEKIPKSRVYKFNDLQSVLFQPPKSEDDCEYNSNYR